MRDWKRLVRDRLAAEGAGHDDSFIEELAAVLEDAYREAAGRGATPGEAEAFAIEHVGDWQELAAGTAGRRRRGARLARRAEGIERRVRARGWVRLADLYRDVLFALRMLRKNPGFTAVAVLTLGLGIGATSAVFGVVDSILLRPLPYPQPERLFYIWDDLGWVGVPRAWVSGPEVPDLREQTRSFEGFAALRSGSVGLSGEGEPEQVRVIMSSANLFELLGTDAAVGRTFAPGEDREGAAQVAVLSDGLWRRRFGADPTVLGSDIVLEGEPYTIIGVMPPDFNFLMHASLGDPRPADLFLPLPFDLSELPRGQHMFAALARVKREVSVELARQELAAVGERHDEEFYDGNGFSFRMVPVHGDLVKEARPALRLLMGAVIFVLLIACANLAALMLARGADRAREIAIRLALGAGRGNIHRQLLTESLVLALLGAAVGFAVAALLTQLLIALAPADLPRLGELGIDFRVLGFTTAVALTSGMAFGLGPALRFARLDPGEGLRTSGRGTSEGRGKRSVRSALVVGQLAMSLVLLVGAGLMIRSLQAIQRADRGFRPDGVLTAQLVLPGERYPTRESEVAFYHELIPRLTALPGVTAAGASSGLPLSAGANQNPVDFGRADAATGDPQYDVVLADFLHATPGYLRTIGMSLVAGRGFTWADDTTSRVLIIDRTLARRFWPGSSPIGATVRTLGEDWTVVGVVDPARLYELGQEGRGQVYIPYAAVTQSRMSVAIRVSGEPAALAPAVKREVEALDPLQPVFEVRTMPGIVSASLAGRRFAMALLSGFAWLALTMAGVGLYGVMSHTVLRRTREIGIRMALGAAENQVLRLVLRDGLALLVLGVVLGLVGSLAAARALSGLIYGVSPWDPLTFTGVVLVLASAVLAATYVPARRASRLDPVQVLRQE